LDAVTDQKLAWWGQAGAVGQCQKHELSRDATGVWTFATLCKGANGASVAISGQVQGDFNQQYKVAAVFTVTGAPEAQLAGTRHFTIDAVRLGACPADMQPGMMDIPGAGRIDAVTGRPVR
jgi:hypothetical protein